MSEQGQLFDPQQPTWIAMIWDRCNAKVQGECIAILAEMGRASLVPKREPQSSAPMRSGKKSRDRQKEVRDEC